MGALPDLLPGYQKVSDSQARKRFEERWGLSLPVTPGLTATEMIKHAEEGKIKGIYIVGENPVLSFPHSNRVTKALASLDFLLVQDMFLTETAKLASVVLPAASFAEKEGTFTNFEGRVKRVRKAIEPLGESLPDWEIILRLADKIGAPFPFSSLQQLTNEIEELVPSYDGYLDSDRSSQIESETREKRRTYMGHLMKGFARFSPAEYISSRDELNSDYPFTLLIGSILYGFGTGTRSSRGQRLTKFFPQPFLEISEADAKKLGMGHGDKVRVISPAAELTTVLKITETLPEGTVFMPQSFPENPATRLFNIDLDPEAKTPSLKACHVRIERADDHGEK
jgi:predicted molibdopterin-dependent oxidoreductase YjgC